MTQWISTVPSGDQRNLGLETYLVAAVDKLRAPANTLEEGPSTGTKPLENGSEESDESEPRALRDFGFLITVDDVSDVVQVNLVSFGVKALGCC